MGAYAQLLACKYGGKLDAEADRFLAFIVSAATRMSSLVQDLLSYARLTTEEERPSSIALDEDLEAAITHLDQAIQESDATITHDPLPTLPVDRGQMVRLFQNRTPRPSAITTRCEPARTGLRLSICRRIVQAHGVRIWAESQPGEGTTFFFTLPVESRQPSKHTPPTNTHRQADTTPPSSAPTC
jgi:light-regulated signal transduction histidine kinase (bacteriophytochrome)